MLPAGVVPVSAQVGCRLRDDDCVTGARLDGLVATGADVAALGLVRLEAPYLDVVVFGSYS